MRITDAEAYVIARLQLYSCNGRSLWDHGWRFTWSRSRLRVGRCVVNPWNQHLDKRIILSRPIVKLNNFMIVSGIVLHEIAHAMCHEYGILFGHHTRWREIALNIGGEQAAQVRPDGLRLPRGRYRYVCPECGTRTERSRQIKVGYEIGCRLCRRSRGVWIALKEVRR